MKKVVTEIRNELILLKYLYARLDEGITEGISESEYFTLINTLVEKIRNDDSEYATDAIYQDKSFSDVVKQAMNRTIPFPNSQKCSLKFEDNIVYPTYDLGPLFWRASLPCNSYEAIEKQVIDQFVKKPILSDYSCLNASDENFELAIKVSSYLINDLIERYFTDMIKSKHWPKDYSFTDENIFAYDIGRIAGKKNNVTFQLVYYQAIRVITELLENRKENNDELIFSNDWTKCLAYANYIKILAPKPLTFLRQYTYDSEKLNDPNVTVTIENDKVYEQVVICNYHDTYDNIKGYNVNAGELNNIHGTRIDKEINGITKQKIG